MFVLFVLLFGGNPQAVASSAQPLYWSGWEILLPHHSQGSSTERWSRNTLRVVIVRVDVLCPQGVLAYPFNASTLLPIVSSNPNQLVCCGMFIQEGGSRQYVPYVTSVQTNGHNRLRKHCDMSTTRIDIERQRHIP